jgi:hypothetical protein
VTLPEEEPRQAWLTFAIGYSALVNGRATLRHLFAVTGWSPSDLPRLLHLILLAAAIAGVVAPFAVLGSKRWGVYLAITAALVLAAAYLVVGMPIYFAPLFLVAPTLLALAARVNWRYMD